MCTGSLPLILHCLRSNCFQSNALDLRGGLPSAKFWICLWLRFLWLFLYHFLRNSQRCIYHYRMVTYGGSSTIYFAKSFERPDEIENKKFMRWEFFGVAIGRSTVLSGMHVPLSVQLFSTSCSFFGGKRGENNTVVDLHNKIWRRTPSWSNFLHFHAVFGKNGQMIDWRLHLWPLPGKSWIRHWNVPGCELKCPYVKKSHLHKCVRRRITFISENITNKKAFQ